jgi:galactokinase
LDGRLRFQSALFPGQDVTAVAASLTYRPEDGFANYPKGVAWAMREWLTQQGVVATANLPGADMMFYGDLPNSAGLSSSASIELATAAALNGLWELNSAAVDLALLSQRAENEFVGVQCGIMDQFSIAVGEANQALSLDCSTLNYRLVPVVLQDHLLVIANTHKPRDLAESKYNERRRECNQALAQLQRVRPQLRHLAEITPEQWPDLTTALNHPVLLRRARHVVFESHRAKMAPILLARGDLVAFGKQMNESHHSLRDDYEVTGPELDALAEAAWGAPGCLGSRMTGAGFGGCTVSLVQNSEVDGFIQQVSRVYQERVGWKPSFYLSGIGPGAREITNEVKLQWQF